MTINYFFKYLISILFAITTSLLNAQIKVDTQNYTEDQLVRDVFFGPESVGCIQVSNVQISGRDFGRDHKSWGYFDRDGSNFDMDEGIILSTGSALEARGPNTFVQTEDYRSPFADASWAGDQDLIDLLIASNLNADYILNATVLEFDFISLKSSRISFEYMFLSEEYRQGNCTYSDAFAFLIKKANGFDSYKNIALVPGTNTPVSTLTINAASGCPKNTEYFGSFNGQISPTNFNGQTKILTAKTDVETGTLYHIKLVIADHGDSVGRFDSAVFLKAGSFGGIKDLGPDLLLSSKTALCEGETTTLNAFTAGVLNYRWFKNGIEDTSITSAEYSVNSPGFYEVLFDDSGCTIKGSAKIEYAVKPIFNQTNSFCKYNNGEVITIDLDSLSSQMISNFQPYFNVTYFEDKDQLIPIAGNFSYSEDTTVYAKVESGSCTPLIKEIYLNTPKKSTVLKDDTICPGANTRLEAEQGYKNYKWMRENGDIIAEGEFIYFVDNIGVGKYSVELTAQNGCAITQPVEIKATELPTITNIEVSGNTATVFVTGGIAPYTITNSWNSEVLTNSNVFTNIPRGLHTVYVTDSKSCETVQLM